MPVDISGGDGDDHLQDDYAADMGRTFDGGAGNDALEGDKYEAQAPDVIDGGSGFDIMEEYSIPSNDIMTAARARTTTSQAWRRSLARQRRLQRHRGQRERTFTPRCPRRQRAEALQVLSTLDRRRVHDNDVDRHPQAAQLPAQANRLSNPVVDLRLDDEDIEVRAVVRIATSVRSEKHHLGPRRHRRAQPCADLFNDFGGRHRRNGKACLGRFEGAAH